ncbi:MAG TPA: hypothetical protein ENJ89_07130 [Caldithrix abyssi]|uniref:Uncharacterized protein n=1 Tax=Caldithrix abyssi TaxID=187145 RepID=A0A7V5PPN1_CALAY|nr:hypothetical protein [Caldithrix abyssi]
MTDSNDPNFQPLKDLEYPTVLTLSADRSFELKAGICKNGKCIESFGSFNVGYQQQILLYSKYRNFFYSSGDSLKWLLIAFIKHIEAAREYSVSGSVLTLIYPDSSYYYKYKF